MCVIFCKPSSVSFPEESIIRNCWDNNPHMGGFMYAYNGDVVIRKGFKTFESFMQGLNNARAVTGDDVPYVCHFRISTQGFGTDCCQPFPLAEKMKSMKKPRYRCNIGIAHNGILDITSDGSKEYSDTMKFIQDYLVNIIRSFDWYKDKRTVKLIENLIDGSRFSIIDKYGHIETLGKGWIEDKGIMYSNSSYSRKKIVYKWNDYSWNDYGWGDYDYDWKKSSWESKTDPYEAFKGKDGKYSFPQYDCPVYADDDDSYCSKCEKYGKCEMTEFLTESKVAGDDFTTYKLY